MMRRWLILLLAIAILSAALGCNTIVSTTVTGSGTPETRNFNLTGFSGIQAAASFTVQVNRADSYKVQVTADNNLWDALDISVSGNNLHLQTKSGTSVSNSKLSAVVTMPSLKTLDLSGSTRANAAGFVSGDDLTATISGASTLAIDNDKFGSTAFNISGAGQVSGSATLAESKFTVSGGGTINLNGSGDSATIEVSGGSHVILNRFELQTVSVNLSGGSEARVNSKDITAGELSGGSHLYYVDNPTLGNIQTTGGSSIGKE